MSRPTVAIASVALGRQVRHLAALAYPAVPLQQEYYHWRSQKPSTFLFRDELLNETLFSSLAEAREKITAWKEDYNQHMPHSSLGNLTPQEFARKSRSETKAA
jgi:transposase InsO family protein